MTALPLDVTTDEIHSVFSKYGLIAEEIESGQPRIKIYKDEKGNPKGEALVIYFRPESVKLAIDMLDDTQFRYTPGNAAKMRVTEADSSFKKHNEGGEQPKGRKTVDQKKAIARTQKLNDKLADWDDDDPQAIRETSSRYDKVVVLKHMFTLKEIEVSRNPCSTILRCGQGNIFVCNSLTERLHRRTLKQSKRSKRTSETNAQHSVKFRTSHYSTRSPMV